VWGTSYGRWESTSDILYLHNSQFYRYSSFHLGGEVYLKAEKEEITLKQGTIEMCFPLIR
jgi:hypothetical protein